MRAGEASCLTLAWILLAVCNMDSQSRDEARPLSSPVYGQGKRDRVITMISKTSIFSKTRTKECSALHVRHRPGRGFADAAARAIRPRPPPDSARLAHLHVTGVGRSDGRGERRSGETHGSYRGVFCDNCLFMEGYSCGSQRRGMLLWKLDGVLSPLFSSSFVFI